MTPIEGAHAHLTRILPPDVLAAIVSRIDGATFGRVLEEEERERARLIEAISQL